MLFSQSSIGNSQAKTKTKLFQFKNAYSLRRYLRRRLHSSDSAKRERLVGIFRTTSKRQKKSENISMYFIISIAMIVHVVHDFIPIQHLTAGVLGSNAWHRHW